MVDFENAKVRWELPVNLHTRFKRSGIQHRKLHSQSSLET